MFAWLTGTDTTPPAFLEIRSSKWLIISTVAAAVFTDVFLYGIVVPVLPFALSGRAGIAEDHVQSMISVLLAVYGGALLIGAPICGWVADRFESRRWSFMIGLLALAGSTIFLVVGNSLALIVVGRILQGLSAAVVWVVGLALLQDTVGSESIGQAMGYVGIAMS
ncbi:MFS general substrate transporter, partial [Aureobasidium melanogenum]